MAKTLQPDYYLTEMILSIQNEIQSAVDYISEVAAAEGSELGRSSAVMHIENVRVKLPFNVELEQKKTSVRSKEQELSIHDLKKNLASRKGFMIDKGETGKMAVFSKLKVISVDNSETDLPAQATGEIEIVFSPLRRD